MIADEANRSIDSTDGRSRGQEGGQPATPTLLFRQATRKDCIRDEKPIYSTTLQGLTEDAKVTKAPVLVGSRPEGPEEEEWSDEDDSSEPSIAPSEDTPFRFTRERPSMHGLELEGFYQPGGVYDRQFA